MRASQRMRQALKRSKLFDLIMLKSLEDFILYTFPVKDSLREKSVRYLWNPIFNSVVESIDKRYRDRGNSRYTLKNQILTSYMGKGDSRLMFAKSRADSEV